MTDVLVNSKWVAENLDDPNVRLIHIDRDRLEGYTAAHIPGAIGWNWKDMLWDPFERQFPSEEQFCARLGLAGISNDTTVVLYGVPVQFGTYAWWVFKLCGHVDVRLLDGGLVKWELEGRPVTQDVPGVSPVTYLSPMRREGLRVGRDDVLQRINDSECTILDHRSPEEYSGLRVSPLGMFDHGAERSGRIPGAVHIPYDSLLNDDTTFKSPEVLKEIFAAHVPDWSHPVISYCRLSHRATLANFAMTQLLGYQNARVYDGSWTEWGSIVGFPIER